MESDRHDEIREYIKGAEFRAMVTDSRFASYRKAYLVALEKYGRDGVHFLENMVQTDPIRGAKIDAAEAVAKEWRDNHDVTQRTKAETRANISLIIAAIAALLSIFALFSD